jgi:protein-S-isoprenylcysteine O-methyltransferase Ste14
MNTQQATISLRVIIQVLIFVVVIPFLPLLITWRWSWWEGWVYALTCILGFAISRWLAGRKNPGLLAERARMLQHEDAASWDKVLAPLVGLGGGLIPLVAGLDARFDWSPGFSLPAILVSLVVIMAGYALGSYALIENRYFSGMVRIQTDRDHHVVSSGPYGWVRHPGYAGALLTYLASPIFLEAAWAFVPVALLSVVLVIRTALEDRTLQELLPGYCEYAGKTRYRLIPGIW